MKINGNSIIGIFTWDNGSGSNYEVGDYIIYTQNVLPQMYQVIADFVSTPEVTPDISDCCVIYSDIAASESVFGLATKINFEQWMNSVMGGVSMGGVLNRININNFADLNNLRTPGIYQSKIAFIPQIDYLDCIIRVYKCEYTDEHGTTYPAVVQEFIGLGDKPHYGAVGVSLVRIYANNQWMMGPLNSTSDNVSQILQSINESLSEYVELTQELFSTMHGLERVRIDVTNNQASFISNKTQGDLSLVECIIQINSDSYETVLVPLKSVIDHYKAYSVRSSGAIYYSFTITYNSNINQFIIELSNTDSASNPVQLIIVNVLDGFNNEYAD